MRTRVAARPSALPADRQILRTLADQALSRTAGAPLVAGNRVRVLRDARENYPAWEAAISAARRTIHIEMYIVHRDAVGRRFVDLLASKAREGVDVRLLYDWFGCGTGPLRGLFAPLVAAGGQVRPFNPPTWSSAFGWTRRNHRKVLTIDTDVTFVSGLCIGQMWEGEPERQRQPWRDTGVEIFGPVVPHAEMVFAESWRLAGGVREDCLRHLPAHPVDAGTVNLRLIPTEPFSANLLRLDLFIATLARKRLWISDAYFVSTGPYIEALKRAAADGVDVRLLLPQDSDVEWVVPLSRSLYRPLLEAGVRIFEWNGTMMHAKTAVADARWGRVGSTNLNLNSWIGNWELDVAIEDESVARTLEAHFEEDLEHSTEVVLERSKVRRPRAKKPPARTNRSTRASRRVVRTVTGIGHSIGAAVTGNRPLENVERVPLIAVGVLLVIVAMVAIVAPWLAAWPLAALAIWIAVTFIVEAWSLRRTR
jgi:phosphatidylserine/phosphatidylglycerophosphate/cardiolipin synthase-like enzyme